MSEVERAQGASPQEGQSDVHLGGATPSKHGNYPPTRLQSTSDVEFWLEGAASGKQEASSRPPNRIESKPSRQGSKASASLSSDFALGLDPPVRPSPRLSFSSDGVLVGTEHVDQFEEQQMLEQLAQAKQTFTRFSLSDIADNPELARAAKMELTGKSVNGDVAASVADSLGDGASRITDLERVRFTAGTADRDAEREGQAGIEDVNTLLKRLELGKKSVNNLLKLVMKLHQAETAYSRTLLAVSRISISNIGSSESCKVATDGIVELPMVIGGAHAQISQSLVECETKLKNVLNRFKVVSDEFAMKSQKVSVILDDKRGALSKAISGHAQACKVANDSLNFAPNARLDPWLTEGQIARGHTDLIEAQYTLRSFLSSAFAHVRDAETLRIQVTKHVMLSLMRCYGSAVEQMILPYTNNLEKVVSLMDPDQEIVDLAATADSHTKMAGSMEIHHAEEESLRCGDLFSSPDIIRQGELESREAGSVDWSRSHFVLTQAGFLYWFTGKKVGSVPTDSVNLSKSSFTGGNPPEFKILETLQGLFGSKRTIVFKAQTVEDCCEWAISIREIITEAKSSARRTGSIHRNSAAESVKSLHQRKS